MGKNEVNKRMVLIGNRLRRAREALGYTQEQVARRLKIGRPRYSDIENGKRDVPLRDLYRFCEFFGRPVEYFLKERLATEGGFRVLFRKTKGDQELAAIVTEFEKLCERMCELEVMTETRIRPPVLEDYCYENDKPWFWGKRSAELERRRLDLGQAPVRNLDQILEEKCGLKIFYLPIPEERGIWGMFTFDEDIGGSILINMNPTRGKQLFSLAHEYGHFVFHKQRVGIISFEKERNTRDERLADYFASEFLMPEVTVVDMFHVRVKNRRDVMPQDVIYLADYFGVSFQAMVYRLSSLRFLSKTQKEKLIEKTWVAQIRDSMGFSEVETDRSKFPPLYSYLCMKAFQQDKITTSKLAEFLELPLYKAMELGETIKQIPRDEN